VPRWERVPVVWTIPGARIPTWTGLVPTLIDTGMVPTWCGPSWDSLFDVLITADRPDGREWALGDAALFLVTRADEMLSGGSAEDVAAFLELMRKLGQAWALPDPRWDRVPVALHTVLVFPSHDARDAWERRRGDSRGDVPDLPDSPTGPC